MSLQYDLHDLINGSGKQTNFTTLLLKAIFKADNNNLELLRKGFPNAVKAVDYYTANSEIIDLEYD